MTAESKKIVIVGSYGLQDDRATIAWTLANAGLAEGLDVTVFLVSSAVDCVRKGAAERVHMNPLDPPLGQLIGNFLSNGGTVFACPPCAKVRGYAQEDLIEGVTIAGAGALYAVVKEGGATLSL